MSRNGQVFFINNRIQNIYEMEALVRREVPDARVAVGHGQMEPEKLEKIILDFVNYEYDVLIATSIVESGIDVPNANTIIINNAQQFGLSDLHQLRGRVGRSNRKAFCYLLSPPLTSLTQEARRRLQAIENFSELGSGIHIAMQDLDIRGREYARRRAKRFHRGSGLRDVPEDLGGGGRRVEKRGIRRSLRR